MENETLNLVTKQDQAELLHRVLASTDEEAMKEESTNLDPDGLHRAGGKSARKAGGMFVRRPGQMSSLSGGDDAIYMDSSSAAARQRFSGGGSRADKAAKERHPLFKLFRRA